MELHETLCEGVFKTLDGQFYVSRSLTSDQWVVQWLTPDVKYEFVKLYVDDFPSAQAMVNQIYDALKL